MATATLLGLTLTITPPALTALRIVPLLSSTASLTHAYMEWLTTSAFLYPAPVQSRLSLFLRGDKVPYNPIALPEGQENSKKVKDMVVHEEIEKAKQIVVPEWFTNFFNTGVFSVIGFNTITLVSASASLVFDQGLGGAKMSYQFGLVAALGHYAFVPLVGRSVRALVGLAARRRAGAVEEAGVEGRGEEKAVEAVREWVAYHKIRMCSVDVLAWGCFVWGGVCALTAGA